MLAELAARRPALGVIGAAAAGTLGIVLLPADWQASPAAEFIAWAAALPVALGVAVSLSLRLPRVRTLRAAGSCALHASVLLLLVGIGWNRLGAERALVTGIEGEAAPLPGTALTLRVSKVHPLFRSGRWLKGEAADCTLFDGRWPAAQGTMHVNRPLAYRGTRFYLQRHGFAVRLHGAHTGTGHEFAGWMKLDTILTPRPLYWRNLAGTGLPFRGVAVFHPAADGPFPRDPSLRLVLDAPDGRPASAVLRPGERLVHGSFTLDCGEVRHWAAFSVRRDPGLGLIFAAFLLAAAGAAAAHLPRVFG